MLSAADPDVKAKAFPKNADPALREPDYRV